MFYPHVASSFRNSTFVQAISFKKYTVWKFYNFRVYKVFAKQKIIFDISDLSRPIFTDCNL